MASVDLRTYNWAGEDPKFVHGFLLGVLFAELKRALEEGLVFHRHVTVPVADYEHTAQLLERLLSITCSKAPTADPNVVTLIVRPKQGWYK